MSSGLMHSTATHLKVGSSASRDNTFTFGQKPVGKAWSYTTTVHLEGWFEQLIRHESWYAIKQAQINMDIWSLL